MFVLSRVYELPKRRFSSYDDIIGLIVLHFRNDAGSNRRVSCWLADWQADRLADW